MAQWKGDWEFRNVMHHHHGRRGNKGVSADTEDNARKQIRDIVSRELFGTTAMQTYVVVSNLKEQRR